MTLHWNHIEAVLLCVACIVIIVDVRGLWEAQMNQIVAQKSDEPAVRRVGDADLSQAWFNVSMAVVIVLVSGAAIFLEPPPPQYSAVPQTVVYTAGYISLCCLMVLSSLLSSRARRQLREMASGERRRSTDKLQG